MAKTYCNELKQGLVDTSAVDGRTKVYEATVDLQEQAAGDEIVIAKARKGEKFIGGIITTDTSLGTATVKIGVAGATDKYKSAGTITDVDSPLMFGKAQSMVLLEDDEEIFVTVETASLPSSGTMKVSLFFAVNN